MSRKIQISEFETKNQTGRRSLYVPLYYVTLEHAAQRLFASFVPCN